MTELEKALSEEKSGISEKAFEAICPNFSFSVSGDRIMIRIDNVLDADGYEVYKSDKARGEYEIAASGSSPIFEIVVAEKKTYFFKVCAYHKAEGKTIKTAFSKHRAVDLILSAKSRNEKIEKFFSSIREIGDVLSFEDLDVAIESLKVAGLEIREKERRRKLEEEAEKKKKQEELQQKRRQAAAERAAARREKKRLEHIENVTRMDLPLDFVNPYDEDDRASVSCDSLSDALMMSLDMLGMVDIEFIASVTGEDMKSVIENLRGSIYQNPLHWNEVFYKGWETADEYLSGNLMHKYRVAQEANEKYNGYFQNNVTALEGILEPDIATEDIYVTLGSPWIPTDIIDDFITYMAFGNDLTSEEAKNYYDMCSQEDYAVRHDNYTGYWEIPNKTRFRTSHFHGRFEDVNYKIFGTERMDMLYILENTLNMRTLSVMDPKDPNDKECKVRVINQEETVKLLEKQQYMIDTFKKWVWANEDRKARLQSAYCRKYGNIKKRVFDGSFLELPGLNPDMKLYDYQKNAIARILFSPNTLLAHDVGAGKTYIMIAAGMELRRLGKSKKNLYVVPNNILTQWETLFKKLYPDANVFTVSTKNFSPSKRSETLGKIKDEDYDAIIMTYSCFDMLSLSDRYYIKLYKERLKMLESATKNFYSKGKIEDKRKKIQKTLDELQKTYKKTPLLIPFDELGINTLFVDEAHNYKNVNLESRISRVRGSGSVGSHKSNAMMDKVHCIQRMNDGGRVVFATGTPITNSLSDIFVMQKYLQEGELEFQEIQNFDAWAGMFAEKTTDFEIDVDTNSYHLVTRFSKFCNIPELTATLSSIADFHKVEKDAGIPEVEGYDDSVSVGSDDFKDYLAEISNRADDIRQKRVTIKEDNMLKVTSDGRKAALDMRLIDTAFGLDLNAKVLRCAENVYNVYADSRNIKGTQLVFCDLSTPKAGFNLYDELKGLLTAMGIPKNQIAFIHDAQSDLARKDLFKQVSEGEVSVLIGSTAKMGHGMNVQKHLVAIHHLDVPWRPSDMVQREGRILRRGNENEKVRIFRYVTKASFDAYSWQLLETKQRFIGQIMSGRAVMREGRDIDDTVLNYAEVKALAVGNPKIKQRVEVCNELDKYKILQKDYMEERARKEQRVQNLPARISEQKVKIEKCQMDIEAYAKEKTDYNEMSYTEQKKIREQIYTAVQLNQNNPQAVEVMTYQGFKVVIPAYMIPRRPAARSNAENSGESITEGRKPVPYVHLIKNGCYYLEIESESGITKRLNNCLENLDEQKKKYEDVLKTLENQLKNAKEELEKEDGGYAEIISELSRKLQILDNELGVVA
ncbi:MAG: DEAD/DEAH box helicase family protein [Clostridiales bacterium]|nr:DEAD/DEAH box helicase family protein [Clostridiales bacterium]